MRRWAAAAAVAAVTLSAAYLKVRLGVNNPRYDPVDDTAYFRAESAFQYRYAKLLAEGGRVPDLDTDAQYPEGVRPRRELTLWMERATAWTYRLWPVQPSGGFHRFVLLWVAWVSSLSIPAFYLLGRRLTPSPVLAAAATAAYGLSWASLSHVIGTYGFSAFALPLIFAGLAAFASSLDADERRPRLLAVLAGAALAGALASWHFTRFFLASFFLAGFWAAWRRRGDPAQMAALRRSLAVVVAALAAAGLGVACLRESKFLLSPTMFLGCVLLAYLRYPKRKLLIIAAGTVLVGSAVLRPADADGFNHVYGLLFEKLRRGLAKPADPALLGTDARLLWNGAFDSPDPGLLLFSLLPLGLLVLPRLWDLLRGRANEAPASAADDLWDALAGLYAVGALLVARLLPIFAFFLGLWALRGARSRRALWVLVLFVLVALLEAHKAFAPASRANLFMALSSRFAQPARGPAASTEDERDVIAWLRREGRGRPVLAGYGVSASFLAYARVPTLLNPKFESARVRRKTSAYLKALFGGEEDLFRFCRENGAGLLIHGADAILDETPDGPLYAAGLRRLRSDTAAVVLQFHPEGLRHFRLVYQNRDFRVFEVGVPPSREPPYEPVYDLGQYQPHTAPDGTLSLDAAGVNERIRAARGAIFLARVLARQGLLAPSLAAYQNAFAAWPPDSDLLDEARRLGLAVERQPSP